MPLYRCPTAPEFKGMGWSPLFCLCLSLPPLSWSVSQSVPKLGATNHPPPPLGSWPTLVLLTQLTQLTQPSHPTHSLTTLEPSTTRPLTRRRIPKSKSAPLNRIHGTHDESEPAETRFWINHLRETSVWTRLGEIWRDVRRQ